MSRSRMSEVHGPAWMVQAAQIARLFYLDGRSKVEIADDLGLSRFKVARILEEARDLGLVEVSIRLPTRIDADLSTELQRHLGGARCIVLAAEVEPAAGGDDGAVRRRSELGRLTAGLLTELVGESDVLGLTCSRTVSATTAALTTLAACDTVQLTGTLAGSEGGGAGATGSVESVRRAADVGGGRAYPIYAPMLLPDAATARGLAQEASIRRTLDVAATVTIAVVAVGGWGPASSTVWEAATPAERARAAEDGTVGEIGGVLFDESGAPVDSALRDRVLGVTGARLLAVPEVVGTAHGADRAGAVRAAVRGGLVTTVVCDDLLASALLALDPLTGRSRGGRRLEDAR